MSLPNPTRLLYEQSQLPVFQNRMYDTREEAVSCPKGDLQLVEDLTTGLVYNAAFNVDLLIYDDHYQNEQGVSALFQQHLDSVALIVERLMGCEAIVEVGCGKGFFLELLLARGFDITGFDPTYEGDNPRVVKKYFEPGSGIQAKGIVLRHVLEHIENPFEFLSSLAEANRGGGLIYVEVPCFTWICEHSSMSTSITFAYPISRVCLAALSKVVTSSAGSTCISLLIWRRCAHRNGIHSIRFVSHQTSPQLLLCK